MRLVLATASAMTLVMSGAAVPQQGQEATLSTAFSEEFGPYVVGSEGRPVYAFLTSTEMGGDGEDPLDSCNADCREFWPLVTVDGEVSVGEMLDPDLAGTKREDGQTLLTYADHPLFHFTRDLPGAPPEGQGIYSYGGYWALLTPSGTAIKTVPMEEDADLPLTPDDQSGTSSD